MTMTGGAICRFLKDRRKSLFSPGNTYFGSSICPNTQSYKNYRLDFIPLVRSLKQSEFCRDWRHGTVTGADVGGKPVGMPGNGV